jgi:hypothetical protein
LFAAPSTLTGLNIGEENLEHCDFDAMSASPIVLVECRQAGGHFSSTIPLTSLCVRRYCMSIPSS